MPEIEVPCPTCSGTGNMTPGGGRNNLKDRCTTCGGRRTIPARPGESREASWPFAVPGAPQAPSADAIIREMFGRAIEEHGALADVSDAVDALCDQVVDYVRLVSEAANAPAVPQPPSSTPGEVERLVDALERAVYAEGEAGARLADGEEIAEAITGLLERGPITPTSGGLEKLSGAATQGRFMVEVSPDGDALWVGPARDDGVKLRHIVYGVNGLLGYRAEYAAQVRADADYIAALINAHRAGQKIGPITANEILGVARKAAARAFIKNGHEEIAERVLAGQHDDYGNVKCSIDAINIFLAEQSPAPDGVIKERGEDAGQELSAIREMLLEGQGDDDGSRILPDFQEGMTVHAMVAACVHLLERRRDALDGETPKSGVGETDGWRTYHGGDDPRPDVEWSGYLPDEAASGPAIAYADDTEEPLFVVWWADLGNGRSQITHWRDLPAEILSAPRPSQREG